MPSPLDTSKLIGMITTLLQFAGKLWIQLKTRLVWLYTRQSTRKLAYSHQWWSPHLRWWVALWRSTCRNQN